MRSRINYERETNNSRVVYGILLGSKYEFIERYRHLYSEYNIIWIMFEFVSSHARFSAKSSLSR